ncbi:hypothetical protein E2562_027622 [Oryza meyeriana var. granulata]|uniref:Uncharacterized protein n=1 Tax=Oryza meyeriana var. granulata TaxID=110450 RepID=A0A6G1E1I2_9ORYZ|nr:hypothetical protein E2562_027622 [Oryza meyeriana var. granulata]
MPSTSPSVLLTGVVEEALGEGGVDPAAPNLHTPDPTEWGREGQIRRPPISIRRIRWNGAQGLLDLAPELERSGRGEWESGEERWGRERLIVVVERSSGRRE